MGSSVMKVHFVVWFAAESRACQGPPEICLIKLLKEFQGLSLFFFSPSCLLFYFVNFGVQDPPNQKQWRVSASGRTVLCSLTQMPAPRLRHGLMEARHKVTRTPAKPLSTPTWWLYWQPSSALWFVHSASTASYAMRCGAAADSPLRFRERWWLTRGCFRPRQVWRRAC